MKKTTMYLDEQDEVKIEEIKQALGLKRNSDAHRVAIRSYRIPKSK